jgi:hypothetical protein
MKSVADGTIGCLLYLEMMEGRHEGVVREFEDIHPKSCALTMRCVKQWFGSGVTVHADSAFTSVPTAIALRSNGLHFMGCLKTATRMFPKKFLEAWAQTPNLERGSHKTLTHEATLADGHTRATLICCSWFDRRRKDILSTRGVTSVEGDPSVRFRRLVVATEWGHENDRYFISVKRPLLIQLFYASFSQVDIHDHYRQGSLALERNWQTKTWWHRIFATVFGMICTDAFLCYRFEFRARQQGGEVGLFTFRHFLHRLAFQLIKNTAGERELRGRRRGREDDEADNEEPQHRLLSMSELPCYAHLTPSQRAKRRCSAPGCEGFTSYYCQSCSDVANPKRGLVCLCNPSHKPTSTCLYDHRNPDR